jgi:hypothetical protein
VSTHRTLEERNGALWFNLERLYNTVVVCLGKVLGHLLLLDEPVHARTKRRGVGQTNGCMDWYVSECVRHVVTIESATMKRRASCNAILRDQSMHGRA